MTFNTSDYSGCEEEVKGMQWVGDIDTLETQTTALVAGSKFNEDCVKFSFTGGLGEKYMGTPGGEVTFFAKPKTDTPESLFYTTDGSDGCTAAEGSAVVK